MVLFYCWRPAHLQLPTTCVVKDFSMSLNICRICFYYSTSHIPLIRRCNVLLAALHVYSEGPMDEGQSVLWFQRLEVSSNYFGSRAKNAYCDQSNERHILNFLFLTTDISLFLYYSIRKLTLYKSWLLIFLNAKLSVTINN